MTKYRPVTVKTNAGLAGTLGVDRTEQTKNLAIPAPVARPVAPMAPPRQLRDGVAGDPGSHHPDKTVSIAISAPEL